VAGPFSGHAGAVQSVAYSSCEKQVVSGGDDRMIRVWDIETGHIVSGPFRGHTSSIESVVYVVVIAGVPGLGCCFAGEILRFVLF
jgi:WD40 repeat protein